MKLNHSAHAFQKKAFTLIELLVVISIIAILASLLLPALGKAKGKAKQIQCASRMKQWNLAVQMYTNDHDQWYPTESGRLRGAKDWMYLLGPYISDANANDPREVYASLGLDTGFAIQFLRCPSGKNQMPPFADTSRYRNQDFYNAHIGILAADEYSYNTFRRELPPRRKPVYSIFSNALVNRKAFHVSRIREHAEAMVFTDTVYSRMSTPIEKWGHFDRDMDGDQQLDSSGFHFSTHGIAFNRARPKIHNHGSNVALLDGHVEYVRFETLWQLGDDGQVTHPFWYME